MWYKTRLHCLRRRRTMPFVTLEYDWGRCIIMMRLIFHNARPQYMDLHLSLSISHQPPDQEECLRLNIHQRMHSCRYIHHYTRPNILCHCIQFYEWETLLDLNLTDVAFEWGRLREHIAQTSILDLIRFFYYLLNESLNKTCAEFYLLVYFKIYCWLSAW
jgi:hypothetical protein